MTEKTRFFALVYQAGIANVFEMESLNWDDPKTRNAKRLMQSDFRSCELYVRGIIAENPNCFVTSLHCNMAGDINLWGWSADLDDAPFHDKFRPVYHPF